MRNTHWLISTLILLPTLAWAGTVITVDPADSPLKITGWLAEGQSFTGNIRLTAERDAAADDDQEATLNFRLLPSDLQGEDGELRIGRQQVTLVGDPVLQIGVPKDFQVTVTGLQEPGTYHGKIELLPVAKPRSESQTVELEVIARSRPTLKPLPSAEKLQLNLVNCQSGLSCTVAGLLLPKSGFLERWSLQFDNPSAAAVRILNTAVGIVGEKTLYPLADGQIAFPDPLEALPPRIISSVPLTIKRSGIPPDHYTGFLYLLPEGAKDRLEIPVDVNVRTGPVGPLIAIFMGIILGRLFKYMQERGRPQAEKLAEVYRIELALQRVHPEDRDLLKPQVAEVRQQVIRGDLATVTAELKAIEGRLAILSELRQIERRLSGNQHPKAQEAINKIGLIRDRLAAKEEASELLAEVKQALQELQQSGLMTSGARSPEIDEAIQAAETAETSVSQIEVTEAARTAGKWQSRLKGGLIALSGLSEELRAEATLWIVRPLLYFVLLLGLLAVGLNTLYIANGLSFGATPFSDYLGLILWGLSADVASRTLSNLQEPKAAGKA